MDTKRAVLGLKVVLWLGALAPAAWMVAGFFLDWLGVNPIEKVTHVSGMTTLVLLLVTLAVTPVRRLTGWNPLIQLRRPLGLFAFFYAFLHFSVWMVLDLGFQLEWVAEDIAERPYITVGFTAFVLLIPLAVTSTKGWIRRLKKRWTTLHALVYVTTGLGCIHFYWLVKSDVRLPLLLAGIYVVLMAFRGARWLERRTKAATAAG
ncbi:MAG TPA: protein-methionine-sulfoxide reductase heme-binding subunit MsrQ [Longimicrobiales bacterium]|nr:protein-methionine-sulfoxide reductase heme-binding subunit MsrQ [Longimicrobiales bacterium]